MAYTEKVSLNGTALSFLLYECLNSVSCQEGFLIGDVTSQITNHISDSQNDSARLDTQIVITTVLPLPSVALFYLPTGTIKEDTLTEILSSAANEVIGWYKYRKNNCSKPTFRDKLISKGLQKYFEKYHGRKTFVSCNISSHSVYPGSTHTFVYRFGKINCFDMYEYVEDVTANLGEKLTGYKKSNRVSPHSVFNKIVQESNVQTNNSDEAIIKIQGAVDVRLLQEAKIAAKNESSIRELEAEIKLMNNILADNQLANLEAAYKKNVEEKVINREVEMAQACVEALETPATVDILGVPNILINSISNNFSDIQTSTQVKKDNVKERTPVRIIPIALQSPTLNYAAALKNNSNAASTSKTTYTEDLITFDVEENHQKPILINDTPCGGGSSPEY